MTMLLAYFLAMKKANVSDLKNNLIKYLSLVEKGEEIEVCKRNIPIAQIVPLETKEKKNITKLGAGKGSVKILGDLTEPMMPSEDWDMLK